MIIYRVENTRGNGPFHDDFALVSECRDHLFDHPSPFNVGEPWYGCDDMDKNHICGRTEKQHKECDWTRWDYVWLEQQGYFLYRFTVPQML